MALRIDSAFTRSMPVFAGSNLEMGWDSGVAVLDRRAEVVKPRVALHRPVEGAEAEEVEGRRRGR